MNEAIAKLIDTAVAEYSNWLKGSGFYKPESVEKFRNEFSVKNGSKYTKIIRDGSAWAFIVNTDTDKKFRRGDILKSASWAAPARNRSRGNIYGEYVVRWTGPLYLR